MCHNVVQDLGFGKSLGGTLHSNSRQSRNIAQSNKNAVEHQNFVNLGGLTVGGNDVQSRPPGGRGTTNLLNSLSLFLHAHR